MKPLTSKQQSLIEALLLRTLVISEAAAHIGVQAEVALAWMQRPFMRDAWSQTRRDLVTKHIAKLRAGELDETLHLAAGISSQPDTAIKANLAVEEQARLQERTQQLIDEMQASLQIPIEKVLTWR